MEALRSQYKKKSVAFGNVTEGRYLRTRKYEESRRNERNKVFNEKRDITSPMTIAENSDAATTSEPKDRYTRLQQWRVDRNKRKQIEKMQKKPAFIVGVMHHKIYSPVSTNTVEKSVALDRKLHKENLKKAFPKGITKATEKRLLNKNETKNAAECSEKVANSARKKSLDKQAEKRSIVPNAYKFKAPLGVKPVLFGRVAVESMSPNRLSKIMSFSPLIRKSGRRSNFMGEVTSGLSSDNIEQREENNADDSEKESSIEEVCLKLSSSEDDDKLTSLNTNNNDKDSNSNNENETEEKSNETPNNSFTKASSQSSNEPAFFSPYIVSSRGKTNARKEQQLRRGLSLGHSSSNEIPTKDSVMTDLNISVEDEERTARYFQFLLNRETERLNELCKTWQEIKEAPETTEDGQYQIQQAIGQTSLLINKKFERFRSLVLDCETGKGEMLVTCKDLQGFWDVICMEVRNCDSRFERVEELRSRGWTEPEEKLPSKPAARKKTTARKKVSAQKPSAIRSFLAERKKKLAKKVRDGDNTEQFQVAENHAPNKSENENASNTQYKTRRSARVTPVSQKKTRSSLLRKVQLSEAKIKSPLTIIKISQMCKTPEVQLDNSISYFNSNQTPGKSILKQPKSFVETNSCAKSACKVNFDDNDARSAEIPVDEETQVKRDLAEALARIDSLDFDNSDDEIEVHAEKKLLFNDSASSEECVFVHDTEQNSEIKDIQNEKLIQIPRITVQSATPLTRASLRKNLKRQNAVEEDSIRYEDNSSGHENNQNTSVRVLRTRTVTSVSTPQSKRKSLRKVSISVKDSESKENKTPSRTRRKSSVKGTSKDKEEINLDRTSNDIDSNEINNKRRQSAKAVKFAEKDCGICAEDKQTFSVTPHNRRSKTPLREKIRSKSEDIQAFPEIPERPPGRVRRSPVGRV